MVGISPGVINFWCSIEGKHSTIVSGIKAIATYSKFFIPLVTKITLFSHNGTLLTYKVTRHKISLGKRFATNEEKYLHGLMCGSKLSKMNVKVAFVKGRGRSTGIGIHQMTYPPLNHCCKLQILYVTVNI